MQVLKGKPDIASIDHPRFQLRDGSLRAEGLMGMVRAHLKMWTVAAVFLVCLPGQACVGAKPLEPKEREAMVKKIKDEETRALKQAKDSKAIEQIREQTRFSIAELDVVPKCARR